MPKQVTFEEEEHNMFTISPERIEVKVETHEDEGIISI